ncbi:hypothetical protein RF55_15556 [Lasius niger]|uniref:Uncharacterized protein n=1 Tax=Lasius niger TaxID=67767 RepID=A0A0J7K647_LASNI|nr:hypothetical protein RF55_15556 [Lasius niger]
MHDLERGERFLEQESCEPELIEIDDESSDFETESSLPERELSDDQFRDWLLSQFPPLELPLPEGIFCVGPDDVDHEKLRRALIESPPDTLISWFIPGRRHPIGVPIQILWRKYPPSTVTLEEIQ